MPFTESINMVDVIIANKTLLTATPSDVASGKQFIGTTQHIESGSLPVNPTRSNVTIVAGESFNIPQGINPVAYNVIAKGLSDQTPGTATPDNILSTKTAWVNGEKITGSMPNIGKEEESLLCGAEHQISRGYHDGSGFIRAKSLMEQTVASIAASEVLENCTCWANGEMLTGTMPNNGKVTATLDAGQTYTIPEGYHNGNGKVVSTSLPAQTPGTASNREIAEGFTAWVNGQKITGIMPMYEAEEIVLPMNGTYEIPNGYHTGFGKVTQNIPSKPGQTVGPTKDSQTLPLAGYYMEGDIMITGVDALSYQRTGAIVKDSTGENISNYALTVEDNVATINVFIDNWHDNYTLNIYHATFDALVDVDGNPMDLDCLLMVDWEDMETKTWTFGKVIISTHIDTDTNEHIITISGITSGNITIVEPFSARQF